MMAGKDALTVGNKEIVVQREEVEVTKLNFYLENPRIYDSVRVAIDGKAPTQEEIKKILVKTEDVKTLRKDIEMNGGLIEPVIVRRDNLQVIEGNRRLAAYLDLHQKNPSISQWEKIKCVVIQDCTDSDINAILGQFHLQGKKGWKPYEQAGFIYRRRKNDGRTVNQISKELGITKNRVNNFINVYSFMQKHGEGKEFGRWSYYDAYLNLRATKGKASVKQARSENPKMDEIIVEKIRNGEIEKAMHLRDRLPYIVANKKAFRSFLREDSTFDESWERVRKSGSTDDFVERIKTFRDWTADNERKIQKSINGSDETGNKLKFEVRRLRTVINKLLRV